MEYLVTGKEMAGFDAATIEKIGIPALVLMERAAWSVYEEVVARAKGKMRILILAGCGNNGADGLALARMLVDHRADRGCEAVFQVDVVICGNPEKATAQWKTQYEILKYFPVRTGSKPQAEEYDILIDALFGVGLSRKIDGAYAELINWYNASDGYKVAVDVPSGVHSDSGKIMGCAVKADLTVCFAFGKRGLYLYPGCKYAGRVVVKNIGIGEVAFGDTKPEMFRFTESIEKLLPVRPADGNKGTFGKVLLAAGNKNMAGAAVLAARGCYRAGTGMVKVLTKECNRMILQVAVPEALLATRMPWEDAEDNVLSTQSTAGECCKEERQRNVSKCYAWPDVLAIGPGLGTDEWGYELLYSFLTESKQPIIIDADGLNLLSRHSELLNLISEKGAAGRTIILTPHVGELARLCHTSIENIKENPLEIAMELARKLHCVIVSKDARTLICQSGKPVCLNTTGNSGMAVAGSGDVLAGIIAGLLAQGMSGFDAASIGVYLHGLAGDAAAARLGNRAMTSWDLIQGIADVTRLKKEAMPECVAGAIFPGSMKGK